MVLRRVLLAAAMALAACACTGGHNGPPAPDANFETLDAGLGTKAFMEACASTEQCMTGLICFNFNAKGMFCTHDCTAAADCAAPSTGCNGMGVCKAP